MKNRIQLTSRLLPKFGSTLENPDSRWLWDSCLRRWFGQFIKLSKIFKIIITYYYFVLFIIIIKGEFNLLNALFFLSRQNYFTFSGQFLSGQEQGLFLFPIKQDRYSTCLARTTKNNLILGCVIAPVISNFAEKSIKDPKTYLLII